MSSSRDRDEREIDEYHNRLVVVVVVVILWTSNTSLESLEFP